MDSVPLRKLLEGGRRYVVPPQQRGYAWRPKDVKQFLTDLEERHADGEDHPFGFMLTVEDGGDPAQPIMVIDGQQRLTTSVLFLACARNFFHKHRKFPAAEMRLRALNQLMLVEDEPADPGHKQLLTMSRINRDLFYEMLASSPVGQKELASHGDDSNKLLRKAYVKLRIWSEKRPHLSNADLEEAYGLVDTLLDRFHVYHQPYSDYADVYRIFELINNRGTKLHVSDHVKTHLLREIERQGGGSKTVDKYDDAWTDLRNNVTNDSLAKFNLDKFLNHYLVSRQKPRPKAPPKLSEVYEGFSNLSKLGKPPTEIIEELGHLSELLVTLRLPDESPFMESLNTVHYLKKIREINGVYIYPVLFAGHSTWWDGTNRESFEFLVELCLKYHLRMMVIKRVFETKTYERQLYDAIGDIYAGLPLKCIIRNRIVVGKYYPGADDMKSSLHTKHFEKAAQARVILEEAEYAGMDKASHDDTTVEHIMPLEPERWRDYILQHNRELLDPEKSDDENASIIHETHCSLIGNQTLLTRENNSAAHDQPFEEKKEIYERPRVYRITRALVEVGTWNVESMRRRQKGLVDTIVAELDLNTMRERLERL